MQKILAHPNSLRVKLADIEHNLSDSPTVKQVEKYRKAIGEVSRVFAGKPSFISGLQWNSLLRLLDTLSSMNDEVHP